MFTTKHQMVVQLVSLRTVIVSSRQGQFSVEEVINYDSNYRESESGIVSVIGPWSLSSLIQSQFKIDFGLHNYTIYSLNSH